MREILFRGKSLDNGNWVYGDLAYGCNYLGDTCIREKIKLGYHAIGVDPDTIGQYTGLNDNNGNKIFEGDILRYVFKYDYGSKYENPVFYKDGCFRIGDFPLVLCLHDCIQCEIVGNIYEDKKDIIKDWKPVIHAHWEDTDFPEIKQCSNCKICNANIEYIERYEWKYCPECGAMFDIK